MNLIKLECKNCNAQLELDMDNLSAYCPFCGQKLLFDIFDMKSVLVEREKTKREQEKTKQKQLEYEYKERKAERDHKEYIIGLLFFLLMLFLLFLNTYVL